MADIIEAGMLERGDLFCIPGKPDEFQCLGWHRNLDMVMYCGVDEIDVVRYIRPFREVEVDNYYF